MPDRIDLPDDVDDDVASALGDLFAPVFDLSHNDPHTRGDVDVVDHVEIVADDGGFLARMHYPDPRYKYTDAGAGGDGTPADMVYDVLESAGVPRPTDDPTIGVKFSAAGGVVIEAWVPVAVVGGDA